MEDIVSPSSTTNSESILSIEGITGPIHYDSNSSTGPQSPINSLSFQETFLNDSRITPTGNGNLSSKPYCTQPTSGQKWWAAVLLGFIFALISSPAAYYVSSKVTTSRWQVGFS